MGRKVHRLNSWQDLGRWRHWGWLTNRRRLHSFACRGRQLRFRESFAGTFMGVEVLFRQTTMVWHWLRSC